VVQSTNESFLDTLTLYVSLDQTNSAKGVLYEDAGDGWDFQNGQYLETTYKAVLSNSTQVKVSVESKKGNFARPTRPLIVRVVTQNGIYTGTGTDGQEVSVTIPPVSAKKTPLRLKNVPQAVVKGNSLYVTGLSNETRLALTDLSGKNILLTHIGKNGSSILNLSALGIRPGSYILTLGETNNQLFKTIIHLGK
jgi:hypothetical protein